MEFIMLGTIGVVLCLLGKELSRIADALEKIAKK